MKLIAMPFSTRLFTVGALLACVAGAVRADTAGLRPGQKEFPPASPDRIAETVEAAVQNTTLHDALVVETPADPAMVSIWEGNKPAITAELRRLTFYFGPPERPGLRPPQLVPLQMTLTNDAVVLPHETEGRVSKHEENPGRIGEGIKKLMGLAVGQALFQFTIGVPKTETNDTRGVLICPMPRAPGDPSLRLWGVKYEAAGHVTGKMLSGLGTGLVRVSIQTSPTVAAPREWSDHSIGQDPAITFDYVPVMNFLPATNHQVERSVGAIEARIEFKNGAGYRRITTEREVATVQSVTLSESQAEQFLTAFAPGSKPDCFALLVEFSKSEAYDQIKKKEE